jgi:hypothetical protein
VSVPAGATANPQTPRTQVRVLQSLSWPGHSLDVWHSRQLPTPLQQGTQPPLQQMPPAQRVPFLRERVWHSPPTQTPRAQADSNAWQLASRQHDEIGMQTLPHACNPSSQRQTLRRRESVRQWAPATQLPSLRHDRPGPRPAAASDRSIVEMPRTVATMPPRKRLRDV